MGPEALAQVLRPLAGMFNPGDYPDLLLGLDAPDDAAVYRIDDERAIVLTSDFFPPVVDDPHAFGAIAAANALSDLYAMGARPLMGINLVAWPSGLDPEILSNIMRGGGEKVRESGAVVAGGHTTTDNEPKYGLAVIGTVHPERILAKSGASVGDVLLLTKPIGSGAITTAHKNDAVEARYLDEAIASMARLNGGAARVLEEFHESVHAATDITGFALAGHAHEVAQASGLSLRLVWDEIPLLAGAAGCVAAGNVPGGGRRNREFFGARVRTTRSLDEAQQGLLYDPQTSGGLFVAVAAGRAEEIVAAFRQADEPVWVVGEAVAGDAGLLEIA